jgi:xylan 1,4-beta-xylosidase
LGAVTWGFEFEDQPWYAGFRDMATNGVDKPVLNVFRMFGMMQGKRIKVQQDNLAYNFLKVRDESVRDAQPDINAIASKDENRIAIMVWNYHDNNDLSIPPSVVNLLIDNIPNQKVLVNHYRVDQEFSNSYTLWKEMGAPQNPTQVQVSALEKAGQLHLHSSPEWRNIKNGKTNFEIELPRQAISLISLTW